MSPSTKRAAEQCAKVNALVATIAQHFGPVELVAVLPRRATAKADRPR